MGIMITCMNCVLFSSQETVFLSSRPRCIFGTTKWLYFILSKVIRNQLGTFSWSLFCLLNFNLSLFLISQGLRHEYICWMAGELSASALATLSPGKELQCPLDRMLVGRHSRSGQCEREAFLALIRKRLSSLVFSDFFCHKVKITASTTFFKSILDHFLVIATTHGYRLENGWN